MLTALILTIFISTSEAHQTHHQVRHRTNHVHHHQHSNHCIHDARSHVWVKNHGWVPYQRVRWIPGHYAGRGHNRHWVPGRFVIRINR